MLGVPVWLRPDRCFGFLALWMGRYVVLKKIFKPKLRVDPSARGRVESRMRPLPAMDILNIAVEMHLGRTLFREDRFAEAVAPYEKVRALEKVRSAAAYHSS